MKKKYILPLIALLLVVTVAATVPVICGRNYENLSGWQRGLYAFAHKQELLNTQYTGQTSDSVWSPEQPYRLEDHVVIRKEPGQDFVIMNVTDIHMSDFTIDAVTNIRNLDSIRRKAQELQPDLITLSGDIFWTQMREGSVYHSVHRLTEFMDSLGIPWAPVFGNHDAEGNCDADFLAEVMMSGKYCVMQKGDASMGVGNYIVNICEGEKIVHSVVLFDSHNGNLWENQVQWYRWAIEGVNSLSQEPVTSSVIMHVPFAQYVYGYDASWDGEGWKEGSGAFGRKGEACCCETDENGNPIDNGFFAVIRELGSTTNALCGHDHANSYSVVVDGVRLTYSLRLGYGAYWEYDQQGVTTLTVDSQGNCVAEHHYMYPYDVELP